MNRDILCNVIMQTISDLSLDEFTKLFINEAQAIEDFYKLCKGVKAGNTISLLFNPHRLSTDNEKDDLSVFESLQDENKVSGLARLYLYNLEHGVNNAFYSTIQRGYQNIQYVNEFPPFVARQIYERYAETNGSLRILDPCSGWGGRMIGAASLGNVQYFGFEPCTKTFDGLQRLGHWLQLQRPEFAYSVQKLPYEESVLETNSFDIALTSPPYYNTEHYSDEPTNSLNKFKTFETWVDGFYRPLICKTVNALKPNGKFILNIGDRKYPLSEQAIQICNSEGYFITRIDDYLSGNGEGKEKFYLISREKCILQQEYLF